MLFSELATSEKHVPVISENVRFLPDLALLCISKACEDWGAAHSRKFAQQPEEPQGPTCLQRAKERRGHQAGHSSGASNVHPAFSGPAGLLHKPGLQSQQWLGLGGS